MSRTGRPTKYHKKYCKAILKYFDIEPYREVPILHKNNKTQEEWTTYELRANDLPSFEGFAHSIGVDADTLLNWRDKYKDFFGAYKKAKNIQIEIWRVNSMQGLYNPAFTIFAGKNMFGWRDKQEIDHTTGGQPLTIGVVSYEDTKNAVAKKQPAGHSDTKSLRR